MKSEYIGTRMNSITNSITESESEQKIHYTRSIK